MITVAFSQGAYTSCAVDASQPTAVVCNGTEGLINVGNTVGTTANRLSTDKSAFANSAGMDFSSVRSSKQHWVYWLLHYC